MQVKCNYRIIATTCGNLTAVVASTLGHPSRSGMKPMPNVYFLFGESGSMKADE